MNAQEATKLSSIDPKKITDSEERRNHTEQIIRANIAVAVFRRWNGCETQTFHESLYNLREIADKLQREGYSCKVEQHFVCNSISVTWPKDEELTR